jgi:hypothetical protein
MNNATLSLVAILASLMWLFIITPASYAHSSIGDGNTITDQEIKQKCIASGTLSHCSNNALNLILINTL